MENDAKTLNCADFPGHEGCDMKFAGTEDRVINDAAEHFTKEHKHQDSAELRAQIRNFLRSVA